MLGKKFLMDDYPYDNTDQKTNDICTKDTQGTIFNVPVAVSTQRSPLESPEDDVGRLEILTVAEPVPFLITGTPV